MYSTGLIYAIEKCPRRIKCLKLSALYGQFGQEIASKMVQQPGMNITQGELSQVRVVEEKSEQWRKQS